METLWKDLCHGARLLAKSPGFTLAVLATLALGIGANTAVFSVLNGVLLRPLPYPEAERIVRVAEALPHMRGKARESIITGDTFHAWREESRTLEQLAAYAPRSFTLSGQGDPVRLRGTAVSPEMFPLLRATPLRGRLFESGEDVKGSHRLVVLSEALWRDRFDSDPDTVGRPMTLDGEDYTVVGLLPDEFYFPDRETQLWTPLIVPRPERRPGEHQIMALPALARLAPGVSPAEAAAEGSVVADRARPSFAGGSPPSGESVRLVPLHEELVSEVRPALLVLAGAVGFVLLIAIANLANLMLARGASRNRELAVRTALGAGRRRLTRQLLTESALLGLAGGALGLGLAAAGQRLLPGLLPAEFPRAEEIGLDFQVLGFSLIISVLTGLLFGLAPAFQASRLDLQSALSESGMAAGGRTRLRGGRLRAALAVAEVALALVLLIGAGLLGRSFAGLIDVDSGYDPANVLTAQIDLPRTRYSSETRLAFFDRLLEAVRADAAVEAAGMTQLLPLRPGNMIVAFELPGRPASSPEDFPRASLRIVSPGYRSAMGIPLVAGRFLSDRDGPGASPALVVNEAFVRAYLPEEEAVGFELPDPFGEEGGTARVVGIVGDVRHAGLDTEPQPEIYLSLRRAGREMGMMRGGLTLVARTVGDPLAWVPALRARIRQLDPSLALGNVMTMERRVAASVAQPRLYAALLGAFAALALTLAAVGIYGVLAYSVALRQREIGVRMAVGARRSDVVRLVLGQGMRLTVAGLLIGLAAAAGLAPALESLLFGVAPRDLATFLAVPLLLAAVAGVACALPAARAASLSPVETLRTE